METTSVRLSLHGLMSAIKRSVSNFHEIQYRRSLQTVVEQVTTTVSFLTCINENLPWFDICWMVFVKFGIWEF